MSSKSTKSYNPTTPTNKTKKDFFLMFKITLIIADKESSAINSKLKMSMNLSLSKMKIKDHLSTLKTLRVPILLISMKNHVKFHIIFMVIRNLHLKIS